MNATSYVCGLDLGQTADYTALAIAERVQLDTTATYAVRHLERFPLRTAYTDIGRQLQQLLARPPLPGCSLAADQTGVGRAVVDMLNELGLPATVLPITITGGHRTTREPDGWHVPKKELVGTVRVLLEAGRLQFSPRLRLAAAAQRELEMFRAKVSVETGHETLEAWRERDHDDIVLAIALAVWSGEHIAGGPWEQSVEPDRSILSLMPADAWGAAPDPDAGERDIHGRRIEADDEDLRFPEW